MINQHVLKRHIRRPKLIRFDGPVQWESQGASIAELHTGKKGINVAHLFFM